MNKLQHDEVNDALKHLALSLQIIIGGTISFSYTKEPSTEPLENLKETICDVFGISWQDIIKKSRKRELVIARQLFCWFAHKFKMAASLSLIGNEIGGKDHTTVIHSVKTINDLLDINNTTVKKYHREILKRINEESKIKDEQPAVAGAGQ